VSEGALEIRRGRPAEQAVCVVDSDGCVNGGLRVTFTHPSEIDHSAPLRGAPAESAAPPLCLCASVVLIEICYCSGATATARTRRLFRS